MNNTKHIQTATQALHEEQSDPIWPKIRFLLKEKGLDPHLFAVVDFFENDQDEYLGALVCPDQNLIFFEFKFLGKTVSEGVFSAWDDPELEIWFEDIQIRKKIALDLLKK